MTKICTKCHQEKELSEFSVYRKSNDGFAVKCKLCDKDYYEKNKMKIIERVKKYRENNIESRMNYEKKYRNDHKDKNSDYKKEYYVKNKDKIKAYHKQYSIKNSEKIKEYKKNHYENHKEHIKLKCQNYYIQNKEKLNQINALYYTENRESILLYTSQYRIKNKEKINEYTKKRLKNDINFKLSHYLRSRIRDSIKNRNYDHSVCRLTGCTILELKEYLGITDTYDSSKYHIDHIIPLSKYDLTKESEQLKAFNWRNLRLIGAKENMHKHNKIDMDLINRLKINDLLPGVMI